MEKKLLKKTHRGLGLAAFGIGMLALCNGWAKDIDYGADEVNNMAKTKGTQLDAGGDYDYMALPNHFGPSGVPVGGIGVGCFDYAPDGRFTRIAINNWQSDGGNNWVIGKTPGTFLALWREGKAQLLQRGNSDYAGMPPAKKTVYKGLFPIAECNVDELAKVRVWSGLTPHNIKDSSLPLAWVEVEVANREAVDQNVAVAFGWQDVIGNRVRDIRNQEFLKNSGSNVWDRQNAIRKAAQEGKETWGFVPRVPTTASPFSVGGFVGVRQHSAPLEPILKTYQNYNNEVAVMAEKADGAQITVLPAFAVDEPAGAWSSFVKDGQFPSEAAQSALFKPEAAKEMGSAVCVRVPLKAGEKKVIRFTVAWFQPELDLSKAAPETFFGKADYGRYYMRDFKSLASLIEYAGSQRERILAETRAWQEPVLASSYPDWLKFKVINSAYTLYTNGILNKAGDFTAMEGGMGGLAGTMDQRICAHPFYFKFFTELDRSDMELFGHTTGKGGKVLHFNGHYYFGLASRDGTTPVPEGALIDNTGGWLLQLAKDYQQSGDLQWLQQFKQIIPESLAYLRAQIKSKQFNIIVGPTTYDDFWHPPIYAYNATTYPAVLKAGAVLLSALGDQAGAQQCEAEAQVSSRDALRALWNGRYFAYGANLDGSERRDDIMFSGQLAGQFISRCFGFGDVLPLDVTRASVVAQLKTNVSQSPRSYAPKVWLIKEGKAMVDPQRPQNENADSTCWPFYLEAYSAMAAIQAGYYEDGLKIMRDLQYANMRNGWTWTQNLWRLGELTYVTAPVSWFITDVLAGASLNVPEKTLHLAPILAPQEQNVVLPVYFPRFWGLLKAERSTRKLTLEITRVFDGPQLSIENIIARPVGTAAADQKTVSIPAFAIKEKAVLDLSSHWEALAGAQLEPSVLADPSKVPFLEAKPFTD